MSTAPEITFHPYKPCLQAGFVEQLRQFVVFAEEGEGAGVREGVLPAGRWFQAHDARMEQRKPTRVQRWLA